MKLCSSRITRWLAAGVVSVLGAAGALAAFTLAETRRVQRLVPPDGGFIEVEGARLHVLDRGTGQPIVLIHGLGGQLRNFHRLVDNLAEEFRVIAVDRPGSGYSTAAPGAPANLRAQAA